jgi:ribosomal protein L20A (L18A)
MKTFEVEGWYRYNNGDEKDYIIKEIVCNTPEQAIEIFNIKYKHIIFFKIDIKEIV